MDERVFIRENLKRVLIKEFVMDEVKSAGFGGLSIQRTPLGTRIVLEVERPGLVIGRKGAKIKELTSILQDKFEVENPMIEVKESDNSYLDAQIMAEKLASALERGWHFRRAGHSTLRRIMENGAKGAQIVISGKLTGDRSRTEKFTKGTVKYCGNTSELVNVGYATAKTKRGIIGVTIKIMPPDAKLPDEIRILGFGEVQELENEGENVGSIPEKDDVESNKKEEEVNNNAEGIESEADSGDDTGGEKAETQ